MKTCNICLEKWNNCQCTEEELVDAGLWDARVQVRVDKMEGLKSEMLTTLKHAQFFIGSRQKMHPTGRELYQELIDKIELC